MKGIPRSRGLYARVFRVRGAPRLRYLDIRQYVVEYLGMPKKAGSREQAELLQGILDLLILRTLEVAPLHGWGISKSIRRMSRDVLTVNQGSLYPALYRLETAGLIQGEWGTSPEGREAKFYALTKSGRKQLQDENDYWHLFSRAVNDVLGGA